MKALKDLTKKEYNKLIKADLLQVLYPEATGSYEQDVLGDTWDSDNPNKPKYKVGDWVEYLLKTSIFHDDEIRIGRITDYKHSLCIIDNKITVQDNHIGRKLTPEEIEQHLIEEAKRRGYKDGITIKDCKYGGTPTLRSEGADFFYFVDEDYLTFRGFPVYYQGEWSEIIKEEPIKIGDYEVKIGDFSISVGCKTFDKTDLRSLGVVLELCRGKNIDISMNGERIMLLSANGRCEHGSISYDDLDKIIEKLQG